MNALQRFGLNGKNLLEFVKNMFVGNARDVSMNWYNADDSVTTYTYPNFPKQIENWNNWKNGVLHNTLPVFNLIPNAKLDITDSNGNFVMYGFYWWRSNIADVKIERIKLADAAWWKSPRYALRITIKGNTSNNQRYACLWAGSYKDGCTPANERDIRVTKAFKYRVVSNNSPKNSARVGWETGSKGLELEELNVWKDASVTAEGHQTGALISFYLVQGGEITIDITSLRINIGESDRETLPLNNLASLALK